MTAASVPACGTDYSYTLGGKLATRTWARGIVTTYGYTPAGELALVDYADATPDVAYSYDRLGRQTQLTDGSGVRTFACDPNTLRPVSETLAMTGAPGAVTLTRNQDAQGRYTGYALNRGTESLTSATYTFDAAGRIATADNVTFGYEPHTSRVQTLTHALADGKTLVSQTAFDGNRSALASVAHTVKAPGQADTLVSRIAYTTNALGQRTDVERSGTAWGTTQNVSYGYDPLGQVTSAQSTVPAETAAYAYDSIGNRLTSTEGTAPASAYTANNLNQYTAIQHPLPLGEGGGEGATEQPSYDADGNMTTLVNSTGTWAMTWNGDGALAARRWRRATKWSSPERERRGSWRRVPLGRRQEQNRLVEMTKPNQRLVFAYDSMGRRWKKEVYTGSLNNWTLQSSRRYLYDGFVQITELDAQATYAPNRSYRWDPTAGKATRVLSMTLHGANAQTLALTHDGNKNTDSLVAADGSLVGHYAYGPFGQVIAATGSLASANPYRFSSEFEDVECGLVYYNYRHYGSEIGRWVSRDPIAENGGFGLFAVAGNRTIGFIDFMGLYEQIVTEVKVMNFEFFGDNIVEYHAKLTIEFSCDSEGDVILDFVTPQTLVNNGDVSDNRTPSYTDVNCGSGNKGIIINWSGSAEEQDMPVAEGGAVVVGGVGVVFGGIGGGIGGTLLFPGPGTAAGAVAGAITYGTGGSLIGGGLGGMVELIFDDEWRVSWEYQVKLCCKCRRDIAGHSYWVGNHVEFRPLVPQFTSNNDDYYTIPAAGK